MTLEIRFLPAREGDAIWIRWGDDLEHQMLVDMGTEATGRTLHSYLSRPETNRTFELLVVTHVDRDHIGGVLTCLADPEVPIDGVDFADIWFNGWDHLHGRVPGIAEPTTSNPSATEEDPEDPATADSPVATPAPTRREPDRQSDSQAGASDRSPDQSQEPAPGAVEQYGAVQGVRLMSWLVGQRWNENPAFGRGPVYREVDSVPQVELSGGVKLTIVGPTQARLRDLIKSWKEDVEEAVEKGSLAPADLPSGIEAYGAKTPPILADSVDLELLAGEAKGKDSSKANGSSIALVLEWNDRRVLLAGDAYGADLVEALRLLTPDDEPVAFDLIKLPHHGSAKNVTAEFIDAVACPAWVFSTDGNRFRHPDAIAVGRVLHHGRTPNPLLAFNKQSTYNGWWDDDAWKRLFTYETVFGDDDGGLVVTFSDDDAPVWEARDLS